MATTAQHVNVERTRRDYDAFAKGDLATVTEYWAPDIVFHIGGATPISGDYRGKEAVLGFFGKLMEMTGNTFKLDLHDILANDTHTVVLATQSAERKGKSFKGNVVHITHTDSEGLVTEFWAFPEDSKVVDEFFA